MRRSIALSGTALLAVPFFCGEAVATDDYLGAPIDCDILLAPRPFLFRMHEKLEQGSSAFIDGGECAAYAESALESLERRLQREADRERER